MEVVTPEEKTKVKQYIQQCVEASERVKVEQSGIKDMIDHLNHDHRIDPKTARKVIQAQMKGNAAEIEDENQEFSELVDIVKSSVKE